MDKQYKVHRQEQDFTTFNILCIKLSMTMCHCETNFIVFMVISPDPILWNF